MAARKRLWGSVPRARAKSGPGKQRKYNFSRRDCFSYGRTNFDLNRKASFILKKIAAIIIC